MKLLRLTFAAALALGFGSAYAFHSGGVAECGGCHSMHSPNATGSFLLIGADQSSTCLSCHEHAGDTGPSGYHISTASADMPTGSAPKQRTPGGDFGWLKKTYTGVLRNSPFTEEGSTHGHNIVASQFGYTADPHNTTAPGGTFPAAQLACNSCHDPHSGLRRTGDTVARTGGSIKTSGSYNGAGNQSGTINGVAYTVGVYRLLGGLGYSKGGVSYTGVPAAKVPSTYNASEASAQIRVAYGHMNTNGNVTWGTWCATCHPNMHSSGNYVHPIDASLGSTIAGNYNTYVKSGDMTGTIATAYSSLTPFAIDNNTTYAALATASTSTAGAVSTDRVMCLSCHRAHATGFPEMLRWNMEGELMTWDGQYPDYATAASSKFSRGKSAAEYQAALYDRPATQFAAYQRVLCNKCHAKD